MSKQTSALMDGVLKVLVVGGTLTAAAIAPNILQVLDKPLGKFFKAMDNHAREREIQRVLYYMKQRQLISGSYDHGLKITPAGKFLLKTHRSNLDNLAIAAPKHWDKKWRLVLFDIPEHYKTGRDALTRKLKDLGFYPLQRSVLVHPYPCRKEIEKITSLYGINNFVSYIETDHIDQEKLLKKRFQRLSL